jgi:calcium-dependent protein kinase
MEIRCLQTLKHPGIVTLHETYIYEDAIYLVTEYLTGQELFQLVDQSQSGLPWKKVRRILYQLLQAIQHCHAKGITHRDISLDNIMIDSTNKVKLIDFGLATHQSPPYHDCLGTDYYIAPEVIRGKYDQLADIWSVGICWFCLATGRPPFHGRNRKHTFQLIQEGVWNFKRPQWKHYDRSAQTLLAGLLAYDPNKRWTAQQALNSPWFDQV